MPDVTVVGGGPAGTISARLLAASGREVTLIEDHHVSGIPTHCAGVVTSDVIQNIGIRPELLGTVTAADVVLPDGLVLHAERKRPYAYVINRAKYDVTLAEAAADEGVTMQYGVRYKNHQVDSDGVTVNTNTGTIRSDLLIGADGQSSLVAASLGNNHARSYIRGLQYDVEHREEEQNKMTLWVGNGIAPGFFAWKLPMGDITRVGLGVGTDFGTPNDFIDVLMKKAGLEEKKRLATYVGKIPLGGRRTSYSDRVLLIGDAAGQIKPVSGGGLYPISRAAPLLKDTVDQAYSMNIFTSSVLSLYERSWKRDMGKSLNCARRVRNFYDKLSDEELCHIGHMFDRSDVLEELSSIDLDNPGNVVKPILKHKGMKGGLMKVYLRNLL